jgi:hypothetical protein
LDETNHVGPVIDKDVKNVSCVLTKVVEEGETDWVEGGVLSV